MRLEGRHRVGFEAFQLPPELLSEVYQKLLGKQPDIPLALAQGWRLDQDDVEAIVEIFAKSSLGDALLEIAIGSRDDPDIDANVLEPADLPEGALLDGAQELDLHRERQLPDLVQEKRAPVRCREEAVLFGDRARKAALAMPEHLALDQRLGDRAAVHGDEGFAFQGP